MRKALVVFVLVALVGVFAGCAVMPNSAILAPVCMTNSPIAVGDTSFRWTKTGTAQAEGILFVAFGDASISAAMAEGGITRIHHVDSEDFNVLGIYARQIITVYGE